MAEDTNNNPREAFEQARESFYQFLKGNRMDYVQHQDELFEFLVGCLNEGGSGLSFSPLEKFESKVEYLFNGYNLPKGVAPPDDFIRNDTNEFDHVRWQFGDEDSGKSLFPHKRPLSYFGLEQDDFPHKVYFCDNDLRLWGGTRKPSKLWEYLGYGVREEGSADTVNPDLTTLFEYAVGKLHATSAEKPHPRTDVLTLPKSLDKFVNPFHFEKGEGRNLAARLEEHYMDLRRQGLRTAQ